MFKSYLKKIFAIGIILFLFFMSCISITGKRIEKTENNLLSNYLSLPSNNSKLFFEIYPFVNPPNDNWNRTYGGAGGDVGNYVQQTLDGGYIIVGDTTSYGAGDWDIWLIKTDINGNEIWNKTYGGLYEDLGFCVRETKDQGFIITGKYESIDDWNVPWCVWLIKTDKFGNISWENKFRRDDAHAYGLNVIQLVDGYLSIAKVSSIYIPGHTNIWLIKTDINGNKIWDKTIGENTGNDWCNSVIEDKDGNFIIVGHTLNIINQHRVLLIKTDSNGNIIWRKIFDGEEGFDIKEDIDGGYIIAARENICLFKIDNNGKLIWKREYDGGGFDRAYSVDLSPEDGYILAGSMFEGGDGDAFLIKIDNNGNRVWEKKMGGENSDGTGCIIQSNDDSYILVGVTHSYGDGIWLIKVDPFENQRPKQPSKPTGPPQGKPRVKYNYSTNSKDFDGNQIYYNWYLNDIIINKNLGPYNNNESCQISITFPFMNTYDLKVKTRDIYGGDSDYETLKVKIPRKISSIYFNRFFYHLLPFLKLFT